MAASSKATKKTSENAAETTKIEEAETTKKTTRRSKKKTASVVELKIDLEAPSPAKPKKRTAKIELWLADRELIERKVIPFIVSEKSDFLYRSVKISVKFTYKNRKLTKTSEKCRPCFRLIAHKEVSILYSPTYDQVMVLK